MKFIKAHARLILLSIAVLLSRLPFLNAGYGVEEDSWGIAVAAYHTQLYGVMEASRLPGHPVNEWIYSLLWGYGPWLYNFLSALCSVVCFVLFYGISKKLSGKHHTWAALALVFTPVVYINSTCTIDYLWSLMFALAAFYALLNQQFLIAGLMLGLAIGCRINSAVLYIPFSCWIFFTREKAAFTKPFLIFSAAVGIMSFVCFIPVIQVYGIHFFSYSDQFPYPNWPKILYKASIGVFGVPGLIALCAVIFTKLKRKNDSQIPTGYVAFFWSLLVLQLLAYLMLPQKSAYLMLLVPFVIIYAAYVLSPGAFRLFCVVFMASSFTMSVNLTDPYRGATYSKLALKTTIAGQELFFDPLTGPVMSDYTKRINKLNYTLAVLKTAEQIHYPCVVICGWWYNQVLIQQMEKYHSRMVKYAFYLSPDLMEHYSMKGHQIYFLEEQDLYNDLFYNFNRTKSMANPFPLGNRK